MRKNCPSNAHLPYPTDSWHPQTPSVAFKHSFQCGQKLPRPFVDLALATYWLIALLYRGWLGQPWRQWARLDQYGKASATTPTRQPYSKLFTLNLFVEWLVCVELQINTIKQHHFVHLHVIFTLHNVNTSALPKLNLCNYNALRVATIND